MYLSIYISIYIYNGFKTLEIHLYDLCIFPLQHLTTHNRSIYKIFRTRRLYIHDYSVSHLQKEAWVRLLIDDAIKLTHILFYNLELCKDCMCCIMYECSCAQFCCLVSGVPRSWETVIKFKGVVADQNICCLVVGVLLCKGYRWVQRRYGMCQYLCSGQCVVQ